MAMANREAESERMKAGQSACLAPGSLPAHLLQEVHLLRHRNEQLSGELAELRARSRQAEDARRAALNLMQDAVMSRLAEGRENAVRRRAEEGLRASEEKYRSLFQSMDEGFFILERLAPDAGGLPDYRFLEANPAFAEQSGINDVVGRTLREIFTSEPEGWIRTIDQVATTGDSIRDEYELASEGQVLEFYAFRPGGDLADRVAVIFKDVTERRAAEQALRENDRRKDEFLATLAHELRNPLAPISNSLQILRICFGEDPTVNEVCEIMDRQLSHMVRLVDDLMEVSRITRGSIELRKQPTQLASILRGALELSRPLVESMGHELAVAIPTASIPVMADPVRLGQVFSNLLNNAAKYTDRGGQIRLGLRKETELVIITVSDTGIGLPKTMLSSVFDMFTQVDRTSGRSGGGLGIGLTLAKRLVEMHGGTISARSEGLGMGSEFIVTLPVASDEGGNPAEFSDSNIHGNLTCRKVVVVDDNKDSADTLGRLLRTLGMEVRVANDGQAALHLVESCRPDLVFLDLGMPGMDGFEVARRIRSQSYSHRMILVALTGWGQVGDRNRTHDAGFDHHLVKPANISALQSLLS